jgi:hypothetical protein
MSGSERTETYGFLGNASKFLVHLTEQQQKSPIRQNSLKSGCGARVKKLDAFALKTPLSIH